MKTATIRRSNQLLGISISWKVPKNLTSWTNLICFNEFMVLGFGGNDHEVEFHEIKIQLFQEIKFLIMRSKLCLFMRSNLSNNIDQEVDTWIMRSKPKQALLQILISWLFLWLTNRSWDQNCLIMLYFNFDLMIKVSTSWSILLDKFDLMNKLNFNLMIKNLTSWKSWISISWNSTFWPPLN